MVQGWGQVLQPSDSSPHWIRTGATSRGHCRPVWDRYRRDRCRRGPYLLTVNAGKTWSWVNVTIPQNRFSYERDADRLSAVIFSIVLVLFLVSMPIWVGRSDLATLMGACAPFTIVFGLLSTNFCFAESDVEINDDMICWIMFGWRWKKIKWSGVERILVSSYIDRSRGRRLKAFVVNLKHGSLLYLLPSGSIIILEKIHSCSSLLTLLRIQVARYGIPVKGGDLVCSDLPRQ